MALAVALVNVIGHFVAAVGLKSMSMSPLSPLRLRNRLNSSPRAIGSTLVRPRQYTTAESAAEPRPAHRIPRPRAHAAMS